VVVNARKSWIRRYRPRRRNGSREVRVIEDIERVHARLQTEALRNPEKPAESDVEVHIMGPRMALRPRLPYVPSGFAANASLFKY